MTLLARDEIDLVDSWLAFHLSAGVDMVIATDNRSQDGTTEVLEEYARSGHVHLIREPGEDLRQDEWVTRMARLAATEYGADWVINSDADEFWWPRGASLSEVLAAVPPRYGTVGRVPARLLPEAGRGAVRRADDRALLRARPDQRTGVPVQADPQDRPSRASRDPGHARQPRARGQPVRPAARMVPDRVLPLPAAFGRPVRAQGRAPGGGVREVRQATPDRVPRGHVCGAPERPDRRLLRGARRLRRRGGARRRPGQARRRHAAPRRAPDAPRLRRARPTCRRKALRSSASRSRPSSRTRSTPSRPRCWARPTSYGCSGGWTSSSADSGPSSSVCRRRAYRKLTQTAKRVLGDRGRSSASAPRRA